MTFDPSAAQLVRLSQLVDAAEARVLSDAAIIASPVGMGLGYMVDGARRDPAATLADMDNLGRAIAEAVAYVLDGATPGSRLCTWLPELGQDS